MLTAFQIFLSKTFQEHYQTVANGLYPDQDWRFVGTDWVPNCLQTLSANTIKNRRWQGEG